MKFIFSFLFGILILSPTFASYECTGNTQQDQCNCAGWGWVNLDENSGFCEQCSETQYSPANDSVCHDCIDSNGNWAESITRPTHSIFDTNHATAGQPSCPWVCDNGYFEDSGHNECFQCPTQGATPQTYTDPTNIGNCSCGSTKKLIKTNGNEYYCGLCGVGISGTTSANNITQCNCASVYGANNVHGSKVEYSNIRVECACPDGATWNGTQCVCNDPDETIDLDTITNLYVCRSCSDAYAHLDNNGTGNCLCNPGYYGEIQGLQTSCTQCPIGMTTNSTVTAQDISACSMTHNTKFCITGQSNSCVKFIPSGATIYPPQN